jgi:hypothetical protein
MRILNCGAGLLMTAVAVLTIPSRTQADTNEALEIARLMAGAEMAFVDLGYRIDWPDGFADPQSDAALGSVRAFLALPENTPLRPSMIEALRAMARARSDGLIAAADLRRMREQKALMPRLAAGGSNPSEAEEAVAWDR